MKITIATAFAAVLLATITACGSNTPPANLSPSSTPAVSQSPTTIPDVQGKRAVDARSELRSLGFDASFFDANGNEWLKDYTDTDVLVVGTEPAAHEAKSDGVVRIITNVSEAEQKAAASAKAEKAAQAALALRYTYTCGGAGTSEPQKIFKSYKEVWASLYYHRRNGCSLYLDGTSVYDTTKLLPQEQKIVDIVAINGGDASIPGFAYASVFDLCAIDNPDYADELPAKPQWKKAKALAALAMCPDAPHAAALEEAAHAVRISDGNKIVGKDMEAGTYRTKPGVKNCYWSRNTGSGSIISNDFVGFAPDGAIATVYAGEGFESSGCGIWTKIS